MKTNRRMGVIQALLLVVLLAAGCTPQGKQVGSTATLQQTSTAKPTVVFMTDFGVANDAVAICKAVMYGISPDLRIRDITHSVTPFSIEEGARFLAGVSPYYPAGTVFVGVVDPGVGTSRKAVVVKTKKGQFFVVPKNGLVSPVVDRDGLDSAREITNTGWMIGDKVSSTFHGRDIFSPVGAHLATGADWTLVGPVVTDLVRLTPKTATTTDKGIEGDVIGLDDPFGSLITNIQGEEFKKLGYVLGDRVTAQINKKPFTAPFVKTFMDV
ncbi:MAG: SAM-dependent chlorinase/fluorinase, partial [Candidatus Acidiferrum sp.]